MKLNKLHWLSALAAFALISGIVMHLVFSSDAVPDSSQFGLVSPNTSLKKNDASSGSEAKAEVVALTIKLAELQSHVLRLNALGNRLADEANIPQKEFNFSELPPSGGPMLNSANKSDLNLGLNLVKNEQKTFIQLLSEISELEGQLKNEEKQLKLLESLTLGHHIENTRYLSGRPISKGWLSSYFGIRKDPFSGRAAMHKGVDFAGKEDAPIIATASGIVSWASNRHGYGNLIEINHGDGYKTRYGHNKNLLVAVGDVVTKGQVIARMGSTGRSTGPHVHYEILRNNAQINPIKYVYRKAK
jgi:murein DD-endopeptidase MepM/ murein hydrolase activator NlpD